MPVSNFLLGLLHLMRPAEWSKSLGNMVLATITAAYVLYAVPSLFTFLLGFASIALLWSGLYTLNDYTDWQRDALHAVKRKRPIPSGIVPPNIALAFSIALLVLSFAIAWIFSLGILFIVCLLAMLTNQLLYTIKPWNFKKRPILDLISGSMVNPLFRYYAGWVLFVPAFNSPLLPLLFIVGLQFGGYGLYRMSGKDFEKKQEYRSSVVLFGEKRLRRIYYIALLIAGLSYALLCINSIYLISPLLLGFLPLPFLGLAAIMLLTTPLYKSALKRPQEMDMGKMYRLTYAQNLVFIAGMVALYIFL